MLVILNVKHEKKKTWHVRHLKKRTQKNYKMHARRFTHRTCIKSWKNRHVRQIKWRTRAYTSIFFNRCRPIICFGERVRNKKNHSLFYVLYQNLII